jgi:hypothetical protein
MTACKAGYDEAAPTTNAVRVVSVFVVMPVLLVFILCAVRVLHAGLTFRVAG